MASSIKSNKPGDYFSQPRSHNSGHASVHSIARLLREDPQLASHPGSARGAEEFHAYGSMQPDHRPAASRTAGENEQLADTPVLMNHGSPRKSAGTRSFAPEVGPIALANGHGVAHSHETPEERKSMASFGIEKAATPRTVLEHTVDPLADHAGSPVHVIKSHDSPPSVFRSARTPSIQKSGPPPSEKFEADVHDHPQSPSPMMARGEPSVKGPAAGPPSAKSAPPAVAWGTPAPQQHRKPVADQHFGTKGLKSPVAKASPFSSPSVSDQCVVCDNGSGLIKVGLAGENAPRVVFPSVVGIPRRQAVLLGVGHKDLYVGNEAQSKRGVLTLKYPLQHGVVCDWDALEKIWTHCFSSIGLETSDCNLLLTECPLNPRANREKTVELAFEGYNTRGCYVAIQAVLALYTTGNTTGLVVDSGAGVTHMVPIYEGYCLPHAINRLNVGGRDLTLYLSRILTERGINLSTTAELEIVRDLKEKLGYVARDYDEELRLAASGVLDKEYVLPDGQVVTVASERFRCAEVLFRPSLIGEEAPGIADSTYDTIMKSDIDLRKDMFANVVLSGGSTLFPGIEERLQHDVSRKVPPSVDVNCYAAQQRQHAVFIGGSILASLSSFAPMWITKGEYDEFGAKVVHQLEVQDIVEVKVKSREDRFALKVLNILEAFTGFLDGTCSTRREIPVFGMPLDLNVFVCGVVDEVRCVQETFEIEIVELKSRVSCSLPSGAMLAMHNFQVMLYKELLDDLIANKLSKATVARQLSLNLHRPLAPAVLAFMNGMKAPTLDYLLDILNETLQAVPRISQMLVEYTFQKDASTIGIRPVEYDREWLRMQLVHFVQFWKGERPSEGVDMEDLWKCQRCPYVRVCPRKASIEKDLKAEFCDVDDLCVDDVLNHVQD